MSRVKLLKELGLTSQTMVQGGLSSTTRMCGKPACPCHQDPAKRHGPNLYLTWRANGKGQALYVPPEHAQEARAAQAAWARYWEIGLELAALHREEMKKRWSRAKAKSARQRSA